ncbi:MAG: M48 family metallopeptidase [Steroidobacteraceae bacterium]
MDFFGRQVETRRLSRQLVVLFLLAVILVALAVTSVVLIVARFLDTASSGGALLDPLWLDEHTSLAFWSMVAVFGVVGVASLYKTAMLSQGGGVVAQSLGGELVTADTSDPERRRLLNVVEEMAIASGVPMPQVFVLDHELGINAFAAGHNPANAAIAVTRGALTRLTRSELQGVIAHEFSHVLNGDMRLNIRMMGLLFGLLSIAVIARLVLRHAPRSGGGGRKGGGAVAAILVAALVVMIVGYVGLFFGRLLQAAVSRSRESLADASAVQFTRDPDGLRGALIKIGALSNGSRLLDADAEEVAHMLFAPGVDRLFATHPPLIERIRLLDPSFTERTFEAARTRLLAEEAAASADEQQDDSIRGDALPGGLSPLQVTPAGVAQLVGNPGTTHVRMAEALRLSLPAAMITATQNPRQAVALLLAFAIDTDASVRARQVELIRQQLGGRAAEAVTKWLPELDGLEAMQRLPAFLRLFPAIHQFSKLERQRLAACLKSLLRDEGRCSLHAYALAKLAEVQLQDELDPARRSRRMTLEGTSDSLCVVFSVLAKHGHDDEAAARRAYEAGMHHLLPRDRPSFRVPDGWLQPLDIALGKLDELQPAAKEQLVEALVKTIANDLKLTTAEAELLRTVCAALHCPLPPLLAEEPAPVSA